MPRMNGHAKRKTPARATRLPPHPLPAPSSAARAGASGPAAPGGPPRACHPASGAPGGLLYPPRALRGGRSRRHAARRVPASGPQPSPAGGTHGSLARPPALSAEHRSGPLTLSALSEHYAGFSDLSVWPVFMRLFHHLPMKVLSTQGLQSL
jgi:hypothetical protein